MSTLREGGIRPGAKDGFFDFPISARRFNAHDSAGPHHIRQHHSTGQQIGIGNQPSGL
jgi:hypothetical protein